MKRVIALTAAALMTGSLFAAPALAQVSVDTGVGANVGIGANADTNAGSASGTVSGTLGADTQVKTDKMGAAANVDADTTAAIGASWDNLVSAMGDTGASASIGAMSDVGAVKVVHVSDLGNTDADALAKAKTDHQASIDGLKASIEGNAKVKAALEQQGVDPSSVVAANIAADGSLIVYVE